MRTTNMPAMEEILLQVMQTRVESARVEVPNFPANFDIKLIMERCNVALDQVLHYTATMTSIGQCHPTITIKVPKNSWHHLLRDLSGVLPDKASLWLAGKVAYKTHELNCLDLWPQYRLGKDFGPCVRTIDYGLISAAFPPTLERKPPQPSTIEL